MLGGSVVKIEISDEDIKELIASAVEVVTPYLQDFRYITIPYGMRYDLTEYDIAEVLRVIPSYSYNNVYNTYDAETLFPGISEWCSISTKSPSMNSFTFSMNTMLQRASRPDVDISFEWDSDTKILMMTPGATTGNVTIECLPNVYTVNDIKDQRSLQWVYLYALALTKEVIGRIRSKAQSTNVPIHLDGDTLLQESASEKRELENQLKQDQFGPVAILR